MSQNSLLRPSYGRSLREHHSSRPFRNAGWSPGPICRPAASTTIAGNLTNPSTPVSSPAPLEAVGSELGKKTTMVMVLGGGHSKTDEHHHRRRLSPFPFPRLDRAVPSRAAAVPASFPWFTVADEDMVLCSGGGGGGEKKRRLSTDQVRALERSFETENKLEPERKARLAQDLGLQPRQVAVWFQNRRARWKTKQLERDYAALRHSYDALRADHDALRRDKDTLLTEIKELKAKLGDEDAAASYSSVKEEPAASDVEPLAAAAMAAAQGSSDSDSSGVVNDAEMAPEKAHPPTTAAAVTEAAVVPCAAAAHQAALHHGEVFFHGHLLKVEDDEAAFLGDDDAACGGFFADLQPPPSLPWWTDPTEHWARSGVLEE
ncbi:hypothetical protein HU200_061542 [Digitaria exilis]|uniref:Homeobox-leucine zipper protein n=1 Tax=Digitaria exilis TaxID=1010633 RepID=A0A835AC31_9POAL|nr:hypothetical protein HU200_061542 [Digitaria exilis]